MGFNNLYEKLKQELKLKSENRISYIIKQTILGGICGFGISTIIFLFTGNFSDFIILFPAIMGLGAGILVALYENKKLKIIRRTINGGAYGFIVSLFIIILFPSRNANMGPFLLPIFTVIGMIIGLGAGILVALLKIYYRIWQDFWKR